MQKWFSSWYKAHKVLFWILVGLFAVYSLAGFVAVPLVTHHVLNNQVSKALNRQVQAGQVRANPYRFRLLLRELRVSETEGAPLLAVDQVDVNVDPLRSLFKWGAAVKWVRIEGPTLHVVRTTPDRFNFSDMLNTPTEAKTDADVEETGSPLRVVLDQFTLDRGKIEFSDQVPEPAFKTTVSAMNLNVSGLDSHPEAGVALIQMTAQTESDETLKLEGKADLHPLTVETALELAALKFPKYAPYLSPFIDARIADGRLGLAVRLDWSDDRRMVSDIALAIEDLDLQNALTEQSMITIEKLGMQGAVIDLNARKVELGRISSGGANINIHRDAQGELNLAAAFGPQPAKTESSAPGETPSPATEPAWVVMIPELSMDNYAVHFKDDQTEPPAELVMRNLALTAKQLTTEKDGRGTAELRLQWADQGTLAVTGEVGLIPFQAGLEVKAEKMDIRPLQPYLKPFAQLVLTKGNFNTEGRLDMVPGEAAMDIRYAGQAALNDFQSVDPVLAQDFLKWQSLYLTGLELATVPFRLAVSDMALTDFYNRLIIDEQGRSNLEAILNRKTEADSPVDETPETAAKTQPPVEETADAGPDISIKSITLQGGQVDFSDAFVKPRVHLPMTAIGGRISGLDAIKTNKADVLLRGKVNKRVPMEIKGQINPLIAKPFVDLTLSMAGIDLSPLTPYSGKYLGYKLDKGQLSMNLTYLVDNNQLTGKNEILLQQLTLGETVTSPKATKLPIKLALALLKDRKGNIDLDLPVSGDLDNPEFSIGSVIGKMFVNLIVSIVSSPFKMLGALFGGGEELAFLDFEAGLSIVATEKQGQLDTLAKILHERPGLKLEIQGQVDPEADRQGLRRLRFEQQLKAAKLKTLTAGGGKALPLEQISLSPEEQADLVREAYAGADFPKPRDAAGKLKPITVAEMEKLLYTAIEITDDDLRILAHQRASAAKDYLMANADADAARLFVIEPEIAGGNGDAPSKPQVKFSLI